MDELSLLIVPGIDGRHNVASVFDGVSSRTGKAVPLKLKCVERRENDTLWLRYERQASDQEQNVLPAATYAVEPSVGGSKGHKQE